LADCVDPRLQLDEAVGTAAGLSSAVD
jgi:hypothetical protein